MEVSALYIRNVNCRGPGYIVCLRIRFFVVPQLEHKKQETGIHILPGKDC